jgi:hypothetical protein
VQFTYFPNAFDVIMCKSLILNFCIADVSAGLWVVNFGIPLHTFDIPGSVHCSMTK